MSGFSLNRLRLRALLTARAWKQLLHEDGELKRSAGHVLADLRDFCSAGPGETVFRKDALEMARRAGRREVFERIRDFLNLDERTVQQMMEIDDGLGE